MPAEESETKGLYACGNVAPQGLLFGVTRRASSRAWRTVEEVVMRVAVARPRAPAGESVQEGRVVHVVRPVLRFVRHLLEMCMVMCVGAAGLSLLFFGAAGLLGYTDLLETAPELVVLVIALNLSVPMLAWMRYRGWRGSPPWRWPDPRWSWAWP